jgi:hypothetical protein
VSVIAREDGIAMLSALMALMLMMAIGTALILSSSSETMIAANFRGGIEARYAAGAMIEQGMDDVAGIADWPALIAGALRSAWVDGPASGIRTLVDGSTIDLADVVNLANCAKRPACSQTDLFAVTADRPWGANNPRWTPFAYGALRDLRSPGAIDSPYYVLLLVGNGPAAALLAMRAEAFGPRGAHAIVEATIGRLDLSGDQKDYNNNPGQGAVKILSWREVR